ncbi:MAG: ybgC [Panacagrimonas sp.]|jgi:acyl-CoA thioester hydrolase|nr:tol-pal system-associated acyl-CoA thioesterase [Panacagrimonas sp.]MCC2655135.1 ybgC [Panacagrimonas sp.]
MSAGNDPSRTRFAFPIRIYWEDTDASGVVYHANYLRYFERARSEWLRALGYDQEAMRVEQGIAFTVASLDIRYLRPARLGDELEATTEVAELRRASFTFRQQLRRPATGEVLAEASVRAGCVDAATFKPRAIPDLGLG